MFTAIQLSVNSLIEITQEFIICCTRSAVEQGQKNEKHAY